MQNTRQFLDDNFLLSNPIAVRLYHDFAAKMPIIDYHNHLDPRLIAEDHSFENITQAWLGGDHYKWRAMRTLGINESYITGNKSDKAKFEKWAYTVPYTMRNPLYHWTHLELQRYFGIKDLLNADNAGSIYEQTSEKMQSPEYSVQGLLEMQQVKILCTTDDPLDDLSYHVHHQKSKHPLQLRPSFRPDKFIYIEHDTFLPYLKKLEEKSNIAIESYADLINALKQRADFFASAGCLVSDHGLEYTPQVSYTDEEVEAVFQAKMEGKPLSPEATEQFKSAIIYDLGLMYHELGWIQQFHLGALRNNNSRALKTLGPDTGGDSIGDWPQAYTLSKLLNRLDSDGRLAKTVIYNVNPAFNEVFATMIGNFNDGSIKGKIQFGSGWWFMDQKDGMEKQINALSNMGLLSCFIGMLTDSRSFLSFPRHEYFRRILCNIFGTEVESGLLPHDMNWIGTIIQDICYNNITEYLNAPANV